MNIYVGNLSNDVTEDDLHQAFETFGQVESVNIIKDRLSGESRGFGFVHMPSREEAKAAITGMNDKDLKGQTVKVSEAHPRADSRRRGGGKRNGSSRGRRNGFSRDRRNGSAESQGRGRQGGGRRY